MPPKQLNSHPRGDDIATDSDFDLLFAELLDDQHE